MPLNIIHTMPLLIRSDDALGYDVAMLRRAAESLRASDDHTLVVYNQGGLSNAQLSGLFGAFGLAPVILGDGANVGIAQARQSCFRYVWDRFKEVPYISEIHVDMAFPRNWHVPLIAYLESSDDPLVCPGILTSGGELQPLGLYGTVPQQTDELIAYLESLSRNEIREGFVHPVVHKSAALREVGGYDTRFMKGKQGYEDDSLLVGYSFYMGTRNRWKPKCCLHSWVYHATMAQRMSLPDRHADFTLNETGLFQKYGAYGLEQLSALYPNSKVFEQLLQKFVPQGNGRE
ncbi:hypothetical protein N0M98_09705 [Paenibacillus doosanensis]|uniref:hypothetical protein n=1 Tax=Paenibacillus doosanensis TaxID=1229154 RepID=UPI0021807076|nr:hypothetical protein [Paenibacillus doosanensis]MCS7460416.1 hypothetical protein [Paenibacillus doosanensis]